MRSGEWSPEPAALLSADMLPGQTEMRVLRAIARLAEQRERPSRGASVDAIVGYCAERHYRSPGNSGSWSGWLWKPSEGTIRNRVQDLMARGLVEKCPRREDRRVMHRLTDRGRALLRRLDSWDPAIRILHVVKEEVV